MIEDSKPAAAGEAASATADAAPMERHAATPSPPSRSPPSARSTTSPRSISASPASIAAEDVPDAKKLLKLTLSLGGDTTQTVFAGIKEAYKPEDLVGRLVICVANLAPRQDEIRPERRHGHRLRPRRQGGVSAVAGQRRRAGPARALAVPLQPVAGTVAWLLAKASALRHALTMHGSASKLLSSPAIAYDEVRLQGELIEEAGP